MKGKLSIKFPFFISDSVFHIRQEPSSTFKIRYTLSASFCRRHCRYYCHRV